MTHLRPALVVLLLMTLLLGLLYPLAVTGIAQVAFPAQAQGSPIADQAGRVVGSALVGQAFTDPAYLWPRPSAAGGGYDPKAGSSGSNLGPMNPALISAVTERAAAFRADHGAGPVPADAVTASASGLDPHVTPATAARQAARIPPRGACRSWRCRPCSTRSPRIARSVCSASRG